MRIIPLAAFLATGLVVRPSDTMAAGSGCPIDQVVAIVRSVVGDPMQTHLKRAPSHATKDTGERLDGPPTPGACILYGDRLEAGPEAIVTIETTDGDRHVGGSYDPVFEAPKAVDTVSPGVASYIASFYHSLFSKSSLTVYATGRANAYATGAASDKCLRGEEGALPLAPLRRLGETRQRIGADLKQMIAVWRLSGPSHFVRATLSGKDGKTIAQAETCSSAHVALSLRAGDLHPNDVLTLEIVDGRGGRLAYELIVVEPRNLPPSPAATQSEWLVAAWRLAAGPPDTRLDSIARLQTAPPDTLAAQAIFQAVWSDSKF